MKSIAILISPTGEEFYEAYGPMTKDRSKASNFLNADVATRAVNNRFGRGEPGFWESERKAVAISLKTYQNWTFRIEPAKTT